MRDYCYVERHSYCKAPAPHGEIHLGHNELVAEDGLNKTGILGELGMHCHVRKNWLGSEPYVSGMVPQAHHRQKLEKVGGTASEIVRSDFVN